MNPFFPEQIHADLLNLKPGIHIWTIEIPQVIDTLFGKGLYPNYQTRLNTVFDQDDFATDLLNIDEMQALNKFKAMKKQVEWLSGRFLIKHLLQQACFPNTPLKDINLAYHEQGAPYVTAQPEICISLSHSHHLTAAAVSLNKGQAIGIDLERIQKMPDTHFIKTAFTPKEARQFGENADQVFKNWTIKEAYLKYIKKGFNESLHNVEILKNAIFHSGRTINLDIDTVCINEEYFLTLVSD